MVMEDILDLGVAAILPVYDAGNTTRLIASDGTEMADPRTCRTVLKNFARIYGIDLPAVRESYGSAINKRHAVPIPFGANMVLIPVKIREKPLGENDGTFGYVNLWDIRKVNGAGGRSSRIVLKCGKSIDIPVSRATVLEYMKNARLVESLYMDRHFRGISAAAGGSAGAEDIAVPKTFFYAPTGPAHELLRESGPAPLRSQHNGPGMDEQYGYDDVLRGYLMDLLVKAILKHKNDKNLSP